MDWAVLVRWKCVFQLLTGPGRVHKDQFCFPFCFLDETSNHYRGEVGCTRQLLLAEVAQLSGACTYVDLLVVRSFHFVSFFLSNFISVFSILLVSYCVCS